MKNENEIAKSFVVGVEVDTSAFFPTQAFHDNHYSGIDFIDELHERILRETFGTPAVVVAMLEKESCDFILVEIQNLSRP